MTLSRRDLFGVFRRPAEAAHADADADADAAPDDAAPAVAEAEPAPAAGGFSLEAFYAARTPAALPPFAVVVPAQATPTTRVGLGRTGPSVTESGTATGAASAGVVPIAPSLVPRVLPHRCLATTSFCSVCVERCPIENAIVVTHGRPQVEASRCDGCGHCIAACPAPILAFELRPREEATR